MDLACLKSMFGKINKKLSEELRDNWKGTDIAYCMTNAAVAADGLSHYIVLMMTSSNGKIFRVTGPLCGDFPLQRPVTRGFDVFFDLRLEWTVE